ncbi:MAG: hypothetical protein NC041_06545 [Bacteroides sp.]|nr:hypothetical protein [Prevotella sp.]MCM1406955.1 hypothetical protein [Treponema brennaborense]MCM1470106.1 hypothetical protein [Bacteroides sp.]
MKYILSFFMLCAAAANSTIGLFAASHGKISVQTKTSLSADEKSAVGAAVFSSASLRAMAAGAVSGKDLRSPEEKELKNKSVLFGNSYCTVQLGSAYYYGIFSRLSSPKFTIPQPLKTVSVSGTGMSVSQASVSSGKRPLSFYASAFLPFPAAEKTRKTTIGVLWVQNQAAFAAAHIPLPRIAFLPAKIELTAAAGCAEQKYMSAAAELRVSAAHSAFFSSIGARQQPLSAKGSGTSAADITAGFVRAEYSVQFRLFALNCAFFAAEGAYTGYSGTVIREPLHIYVNPQFGTGSKISGGAVLDAAVKYTSAKKTESVWYGTAKCAVQYRSFGVTAVQSVSLKNMYFARKQGATTSFADCFSEEWQPSPQLFDKNTVLAFSSRAAVRPLWFARLDRMCSAEITFESYPGKPASIDVWEFEAVEKIYASFTNKKSGKKYSARIAAGGVLEVKNTLNRFTLKTEFSCGNAMISGQAVQSLCGGKNKYQINCSWTSRW